MHIDELISDVGILSLNLQKRLALNKFSLLAADLKFASSVVVFFCRHTFHEDCLPAHAPASSKLAFNM